MPLTDELGNAVMDEMRRNYQNFPYRIPHFSGGYFESWLSRLAEPQPDLDEAANLENRAWFTRMSEAIHAMMIDCESRTLEAEPPWWLLRLIGLAHVQRFSIVTFNYDTLIEHAVQEGFLFDWDSRNRIFPAHIVNHTPPLPYRPGMFGTPDAVTFRLIKLHGSLDSYWVSDDRSGATINRFDLAGQWRSPQPVDMRRLQRELPGRVPFIVPPAAAKSIFYGNPVIRELWRGAADAIANASEVALMGYSLPQTDLVVSGMISERLGPRTSPVKVVNLNPAEVVQRLEYLGLDRSRISEKPGRDACTNYVSDLETDAAREVCESIRHEPENLRVLVSIAEFWTVAVTDVEVEPDVRDRALLILEPGPVGWARATRQRNPDDPSPLTVSSLGTKIGDRGILEIEFRDGDRAKIISKTRWSPETGHNGNWLVLIPSAVPRSSYQEL
jgi:hypothetical protein